MPKRYKLTYFNFRAKGETARMLFRLADQEFEDVRIEYKDWHKHKSETPMGMVPFLEIDGHVLCQANAINRYLASEFGFEGQTTYDQARATMIADSIEDVFMIGKPLFWEDGVEDKRRENYNNILLPFLEKLTKILEENNNGNGFFIGNNLTWADLVCVNMLECFGHPGAFGCNQFWDDFPKLKDLKVRVESVPQIAKWIRERPKTDI